MTPEQLTHARRTLGQRWAGRALSYGEMAHVLRLKPANGAETIIKMEAGKAPISGPVSVAVEMMLAGAIPSTKDEALAPTHARTSVRGPLGENAVGQLKRDR